MLVSHQSTSTVITQPTRMSPPLDQYEFSMESCSERGCLPLLPELCQPASTAVAPLPPLSLCFRRLLWMLVPNPILGDTRRTEWIRKCSQPRETPSAPSWSISKPCVVPSGKISPCIHRVRMDAGHTSRSNCYLQILPGPHLLKTNMSNSSGFLEACV